MQSPESNDNSKENLFVTDEQTYGGTYKQHLFEQYKLCVEMADRVSSRRSTANNFFLTLNSLLITTIGILSRIGISGTSFNVAWIIVASIAGTLFCWCWLSIIDCHATLNFAKFKVINSIEKRLPTTAFQTEWNHLNCSEEGQKYHKLTKVERWIPKVFASLYVALIVFAILSAVWPLAAPESVL